MDAALAKCFDNDGFGLRRDSPLAGEVWGMKELNCKKQKPHLEKSGAFAFY
jgi:hypothetical protein